MITTGALPAPEHSAYVIRPLKRADTEACPNAKGMPRALITRGSLGPERAIQAFRSGANSFLPAVGAIHYRNKSPCLSPIKGILIPSEELR